MKPDLRLVSDKGPMLQDLPRAEHFAFIDTGSGTLIFHNGRMVDPATATDRVCDLLKGCFDDMMRRATAMDAAAGARAAAAGEHTASSDGGLDVRHGATLRAVAAEDDPRDGA